MCEVRHDLITSQEAKISSEEEASIREEIRKTQGPEMRQEVQSKFEEEIRAGLWDKEGVAIKAQLMKDILPGLLERARNEVIAGNLVKMKEDVTRELKEENRKRFEATGFL